MYYAAILKGSRKKGLGDTPKGKNKGKGGPKNAKKPPLGVTRHGGSTPPAAKLARREVPGFRIDLVDMAAARPPSRAREGCVSTRAGKKLVKQKSPRKISGADLPDY